ncbi:hypothetical protein LSUE1_G008542 [Lachnellula suecica]|uniref:Sterol uptake control protein 2 n=1 Tax=Lachnellula suecica TaxID=602035 RepID=A0A8T9BUY2_9HELO|nr:hypothetical protein LSUE1_G008542 [Lachnellula suecica]
MAGVGVLLMKAPGVQDLSLPSKENLFQCPSLDESDCLLLSHYVDSTSLSISNDKETKFLWQTTVTHLAYQHPFLMHGILACAALHQAYLDPSNQASLIIKATTHQASAMPAFRSAIANITPSNSEAFLVFSHLLIIYSFASEKQDEHLFLAESTDDRDSGIIPPWLYFLRNGCSLMCDIWDHLITSPVGALATAWDIPILTPASQTPLVTHLLSIIPSSTSPSTWGDELTGLYTSSALALGAAFHSVNSINGTLTPWNALRVWPMDIPDRYLEVLSARHPSALILLAHYCVLLRRIEGHWYFEGRAARLLGTVLKFLGEEWHWCIEWPLKEVGLTRVKV